MITLINSGYHFVGTSTLTTLLAKSYANLMNQQTLFVSLSSSDFYKSSLAIDQNWEPQSIKNILNKVHGKDSVAPFFYQVENNLYYYQTIGSTLKTTDGQKDLQSFFIKIRKEFQTIFVDIDSEIYGFIKLAPIADKVLLIVPPDVKAIEIINRRMNEVISNYTHSHGVKLKADIFYVLMKYDKTISLSKVYKLLEVGASSINEIGYSKVLAKERNNGKIDTYLNNLLTVKISIEDSILASNLKKLLRKLGVRI